MLKLNKNNSFAKRLTNRHFVNECGVSTPHTFNLSVGASRWSVYVRGAPLSVCLDEPPRAGLDTLKTEPPFLGRFSL